jgi:hypothetical protein
MLRQRDWAERMYRDRTFTRRLAHRWQQLRRAGLRQHVLATIDRSHPQLRGAIARRIWPNPRARQLPRRASVPALLAEPPNPLDRPQHRPPLTQDVDRDAERRAP